LPVTATSPDKLPAVPFYQANGFPNFRHSTPWPHRPNTRFASHHSQDDLRSYGNSRIVHRV